MTSHNETEEELRDQLVKRVTQFLTNVPLKDRGRVLTEYLDKQQACRWQYYGENLLPATEHIFYNLIRSFDEDLVA